MQERSAPSRSTSAPSNDGALIGRVDVSGTGLSDRDRAILAFEAQWWKNAGAKDEAIRDEFGFSAARYYQVLGVLIDSADALVSDPMLVKRLQRMRDERRASRSRRSVPGNQ